MECVRGNLESVSCTGSNNANQCVEGEEEEEEEASSTWKEANRIEWNESAACMFRLLLKRSMFEVAAAAEEEEVGRGWHTRECERINRVLMVVLVIANHKECRFKFRIQVPE